MKILDLKCKHCGTELKMEYTYCPRCGKKIMWQDDAELYYSPQSNDGRYKIFKKEAIKK